MSFNLSIALDSPSRNFIKVTIITILITISAIYETSFPWPVKAAVMGFILFNGYRIIRSKSPNENWLQLRYYDERWHLLPQQGDEMILIHTTVAFSSPMLYLLRLEHETGRIFLPLFFDQIKSAEHRSFIMALRLTKQ